VKTFKVYWVKEAMADLYEIIEYISKDKIQASKILYQQIKYKCLTLKQDPNKYRMVPELLDMGIKTYREIIHKSYRIIYKVTEKEVYVIAVIDGRRDLESFILNRILRENLQT
jgi:plasmid stabilization system protein ParE